jgi:hypothetical protein
MECFLGGPLTKNDDGCWDFNGSTKNESVLRPLCQRVEEALQTFSSRLYRYFASVDDPLLTGHLGTYYSGFQAPAAREWPYSIESARASFDHLIYIRDITCLDPTGCTITYAHELQHVVQHRLYPKLLEINRVLRRELPDFEPLATEVDLPAEVDVNIVSKRVAESVCGPKAVREFAENRISAMHAAGAAAQRVRWEFFLNIPSTTVYEPLAPTLKAVTKYKDRINFGMDVETPEWWVGPVT